MNHLEIVPAEWDDERDTAFFRITSRLFSATYAAGASALLASYDDEPALAAVGA